MRGSHGSLLAANQPTPNAISLILMPAGCDNPLGSAPCEGSLRATFMLGFGPAGSRSRPWQDIRFRGRFIRGPYGETPMTTNTERAVLAGGCFWGMQDLIRRKPGVIATRVGYSGGDVKNATYRNHGSHAEAIEIIFDPRVISFQGSPGILLPDPRSVHPRPPGQRPRHQLSFGDLLHQSRAGAGGARYHRRCRRLRPLAGQGGDRSLRPSATSGRPSRSIRIIWSAIRPAIPVTSSAPAGSCRGAWRVSSVGRPSFSLPMRLLAVGVDRLFSGAASDHMHNHIR